MKVCVIGTGYVGLVTGVCLAEIGNKVLCVDKDKEKINLIEKEKNCRNLDLIIQVLEINKS